MQSSSRMTSNNSNFWSNGAARKRKAAASDLDDRSNTKMFVTEDKMVKEMQTLSLDLAALNNQPIVATPQINRAPRLEQIPTHSLSNDEEDETESISQETRYELHQLLRDSLKNDDLQDSLINKLCEAERRKLAMQIVPYMPIHPAQLNSDSVTRNDKSEENEEDEDGEEEIPSPAASVHDNHLFKIPSAPTVYTVEEPSESTGKRNSTMKRSYSQSNQSNGNLSVTELKHDAKDLSALHHSNSDYFIVEPTATTFSSSSPSLSNGSPSVRITEFVDNSPSTTNNDLLDDDDIDMQSVASSDTGDRMEDD